jgi:hypothetical protein
MSAIWPEGNDDWLFASPADWIMPGTSPPVDDYQNDPPAATGAKVVVSDTDHYAPCDVDAVWAWKSFTRGLNSSQLDCGIGDPANPNPEFDYLEPARLAQGDVSRLAATIDLLATEPHGELTSTGYALADPGVAYVVLQPEPAASFTVTLESGTYSAQWFNIDDRVTAQAEEVTVSAATTQTFTSPFTTLGRSVLQLTRTRG